MQHVGVRYWRDKQGHEVDFVFAPKRGTVAALECKWSAKDFDPAGLHAFARNYPDARLLVLAADIDRPFKRTYESSAVEFVGLNDALSRLVQEQ